jgi:hypothetical protein
MTDHRSASQALRLAYAMRAIVRRPEPKETAPADAGGDDAGPVATRSSSAAWTEPCRQPDMRAPIAAERPQP